MAYEEVRPLSNAKKFDHEGQVVEGVLEEIRENVGANESNVYGIKTANGQEAYWGANALDPLLANVAIGSKVRITLLSMQHKFPNGRVGKNFKVEVDK